MVELLRSDVARTLDVRLGDTLAPPARGTLDAITPRLAQSATSAHLRSA